MRPGSEPEPGARELLGHARLEVIPMGGVDQEVALLPPGTTVAVTCSPRRGIEGTVALAERCAALGMRVVPHVAARLVDGPGHLQDVAGRYAALGVRDVFVIGGDGHEPAGSFRSAIDLLEALANIEHTFDRIGVGAYPEGHPLIDDRTLRRALRDKQPFATYMTSQICFRPETIFRWLRGLREEGITLPLRVGVPGAVKRRKLLEVSLRVGVGDSVRYLGKHGNLVARLMRRGGYRPDGLVAATADAAGDPSLGVEGFHIFTFNQVQTTEAWRQRLLSPPGHSGFEEQGA